MCPFVKFWAKLAIGCCLKIYADNFNPHYSWVFVMKSQNIDRIGKHRGFLVKELLPNFELNKSRAFPIIEGSLAL